MFSLRSLFARRGRYDELSASIQEHLDEKIADLMDSGLSREDAERAARREFGNVARIEERSREVWQWRRLESLAADAKYALRQLTKSPAFTATAVLTLALGIGANTGIFTLTRSLLLQPLPVQDPGRLVRVSIDLHRGGASHDVPLNSFLIDSLRRHATTLAGTFGWSQYLFVLKEDAGPRVYDGAVVSGNTFQVLGLRPAAGRLLTPADDQQGGGPDGWAAVLSYRFWQQHYGGQASILGKTVTLSDHRVTIVGVAPQGFEGMLVGARPDFFLPLEYEPVMRGAASMLRQPGGLWLFTWARVRPGVSLQAATAQVQSLFQSAIDEDLPGAMRHAPVVAHAAFAVRPGGTGWTNLRNQYTRPLLLLQILVGVVLLVCCVNLAGLCLARASTREHEFAIRAALGAGRSRLMQQILTESLLLALAGGAVAVAFSWMIDRYLLRFLGNRQAAAALATRPDFGILALTGGCAILCAFLFGMLPAWLASHFPLEPALRSSGKNQSQGAGRSLLLRRFFVPAQLALTLGLVAVAAMLGATVMHLRANQPGFQTENVLLFNTDFQQLPQKGKDLLQLYGRIVQRMEQMPGVESASVALNTPLSGRGYVGDFAAANDSSSAYRYYDTNEIGPGYFATLGTPLLAGRDFDATDNQNTCILSRAAAAALFPKSAAVGQTVRQNITSMSTGASSTADCRVIGVAADTRYANLRDAPAPLVYTPYGAGSDDVYSTTLIVHAQTVALATAAYTTALHELAPDSPETDPILLAAQFDDSIARESLLSVLSSFFAVLALLLSGIGIYGLTASWVARRTAEIGMRMALGATRGRIVSLVLRQVAVLLMLGVATGGCLAFFAGRAIRAFLYEVNPSSLGIFALAVLSLGLVALLAALLPARRAASVDPMQALRTE